MWMLGGSGNWQYYSMISVLKLQFEGMVIMANKKII